MEKIMMVLQFLTAYLFLSTAFHKLFHYRQHQQHAENYEVLPRIFIPAFVMLSTLAELTLSLSLLFSVFIREALAAALMLLLAYSYAVLINLIRGRKDLSCGCGGLAGNKVITYKTIWRNLIFILLILLQIGSASLALNAGNEYGSDYFILLVFSGITLASGYVFLKFNTILKELN
ncbi:MauE/DoxX family redox-associated membrane protein [Bacillus salacetis]|uniref:MauE/DoxX family redox-associated membrane protein n=1 Tax=Bacillus salacetis TaxID=2315464 RepID=UPI003BA3D173